MANTVVNIYAVFLSLNIISYSNLSLLFCLRQHKTEIKIYEENRIVELCFSVWIICFFIAEQYKQTNETAKVLRIWCIRRFSSIERLLNRLNDNDDSHNI